MQARGRAAQTLWQAYVQQRSSSLGLSLPSSKSLWDIVNRSRLEPHNADAIRDIWVEVGAALQLPGCCCQPGMLLLLLPLLCQCCSSWRNAAWLRLHAQRLTAAILRHVPSPCSSMPTQ